MFQFLLLLSALAFAQTAFAGKSRWLRRDDTGPWLPPKQTAANNIGPEDVAEPPSPTSPAELGSLERRQASNTCGYVSGRSDLAWSCGGGYICIYNSVFSVAGCCPNTACTLSSVCHDYGVYTNGGCDNLGPGTVCCENQDLPYCLIYTYLDLSYSLIQCAASLVETRIPLYYTTTGGSTTTTPSTGTTSSSTAAAASSTTAAASSSGPGNSDTSSDADGGFSRSDKIALGCGIGIGLPATIAGIWTCVLAMRGRF